MLKDSNLNDIQKKIENSNLILKLSGFKRKKNETLSKFIFNFLSMYNKDFPTLRYIQQGTWIQDTPANKRRSLGDVFLICKYYYPECSLVDVFTILHVLVKSIQGFRTSYCFTINKRVWYHSVHQNNEIWNKNKFDEYKHRYSYYENRINDELNNLNIFI